MRDGEGGRECEHITYHLLAICDMYLRADACGWEHTHVFERPHGGVYLNHSPSHFSRNKFCMEHRADSVRLSGQQAPRWSSSGLHYQLRNLPSPHLIGFK